MLFDPLGYFTTLCFAANSSICASIFCEPLLWTNQTPQARHITVMIPYWNGSLRHQYHTWGVSFPTRCVIGSFITTSTLQLSLSFGMLNTRFFSDRNTDRPLGTVISWFTWTKEVAMHLQRTNCRRKVESIQRCFITSELSINNKTLKFPQFFTNWHSLSMCSRVWGRFLSTYAGLGSQFASANSGESFLGPEKKWN